ncbi:MAG: response regulator transcription factor [Halioglobus sp.]|nr:response regulator transcription factor [Halioglobus sp.]
MKILVVDDESLARERLLRLVQKLQPGADCRQAANGEQALAMVERHRPDLLLLDIRMPGMSGIELASRLNSQTEPPAVIFCTAYDEYALQALRHQAVDYLLKPVREAELARALATAGRVNRVQLASLAALADTQRAAEAPIAGCRSHLSSQGHRGFETMPVADIRCLLAEQKYVTACSPTAELLVPDTLKELEREFGNRFLRVHRNALVARAHIIRLQRDEDGPWYVVLDGVSHRPVVSRRHLGQVKERLVAG